MLIVQICCIANPTILAMRLIYFVYHSCLPPYTFSHYHYHFMSCMVRQPLSLPLMLLSIFQPFYTFFSFKSLIYYTACQLY